MFEQNCVFMQNQEVKKCDKLFLIPLSMRERELCTQVSEVWGCLDCSGAIQHRTCGIYLTLWTRTCVGESLKDG